ncbi:hypothetical protein FGG78_21275 [Thioclava sp. BHET1]|nr:hypothetical protein FGG78_21275 [Thioclava sp. BHET1]
MVVQTQRGYRVYHDDDVLLRRPGSEIVTRSYSDGSVLTRLTQPDGTVILTVRSADGRALRRIVRYPHRTQPVVLFDDTQPVSTPDLQDLPPQSSVEVVYNGNTDPGMLRSALTARPDVRDGEYYSLDQIRNHAELRYLAPEIDVAALNFPSGSSAISDAQAARLADLGRAMADVVRDNPDALFLVEGHSDAVGDAVTNLALSDARAEAMAQVLSEQYGVPPQNIITQGYGETDLKHQTNGPDEVNRRIIIRPISGLLPPPAPGDQYSDQVWGQ